MLDDVHVTTTNTPVTPGLYRRREVAQRLGISVSAVDLLDRRGALEAVRIPDLRCVRYRAEDVEALLARWSAVAGASTTGAHA